MGWVREVQGLKSGPPADWAEFVRRNARNVPARIASPGSAPRPAPAEPPAPQPSRAAAHEVRPEEVAPMPKASVLRVVRAPEFQELRVERPVERAMPRFEHREASPIVSPRNEVPEQVPRPGLQVHPPASRAETYGSAVPERTGDHAQMMARVLATTTSSPGQPGEHFTAAAGSRVQPPLNYPWSEESAAGRRTAPEQGPQEDLATLIERSWPDLAEKEEQALAQPPGPAPERPEIRWSGPWPDLPEEASPPESVEEAGALLRQWERLSRLDREQRGE